MRNHTLVFGAGGHGKVVADVVMAAGHDLVGFVDDDPNRHAPGLWGIPVFGWEDCRQRWTGPNRPTIALGIGADATREKIFQRIVAEGFHVLTAVHPSAVVSPRARIGAGVVLMALAAVNPDAEVGDGVILNTGCVVEHDCKVGRFTHISPNATLGGGVTIGDRTHIGLGASVLPYQVVGDDVRVGAGAVVHRPVASGLTVAGVPARILKVSGAAKGAAK